jgi:hypothetical protein
LFCLFDKLTVELDKDHLMLLAEYDENILHYDVQVLDNNEEQQDLWVLRLLKVMMKDKLDLQVSFELRKF